MRVFIAVMLIAHIIIAAVYGFQENLVKMVWHLFLAEMLVLVLALMK